MAGSIREFVYALDNGTEIAVKLDESNIEVVNDGVNVAPPAIGTPIMPVASKLRYAIYTSQDGSVTRKIPVLRLAQLGNVPPTISVQIGPGSGAGGTMSPVQLSLSGTRGEKFARTRGGDSGLNDGDLP